jgi:hypothetical protein
MVNFLTRLFSRRRCTVITLSQPEYTHPPAYTETESTRDVSFAFRQSSIFHRIHPCSHDDICPGCKKLVYAYILAANMGMWDLHYTTAIPVWGLPQILEAARPNNKKMIQALAEGVCHSAPHRAALANDVMFDANDVPVTIGYA